MKNSFFTLILLINLSCFILSCGDKETGGGGTGGGGGSSLTSSASLLSGAYSIDPNGSGSTLLPPQDDPQGIEDPGMPSIDDGGDTGSSGSAGGGEEAGVYRGPTCFPGVTFPPQIPCSSFSVCAFTMDGTPQNIGGSYQKIKQGKKFENIYINFKVNYLTPSYFQHWDKDELGYQASPETNYVVPIIVSGKVQYTKDLLGSALIEEDLTITKKFDLARGPAESIPPLAQNVLMFKNIQNRYAFSKIHTQSLMKSGVLARVSQQLWRTMDAKNNHTEPSLSGNIPTLKKLSLKIPLRKDPQGNWHYQEVIFRNVMVHRVLWGSEPTDFKGISGNSRVNGCYEYLPPGIQAPWDGANFNVEQGQDTWWKTQWEVPWQ